MEVRWKIVVVWEVRKRGVTVKDMTGVQLFVFQGVHTKTNDNGVVVWEVRKRGVTVKDMTGVQLFVFQGVHTKTNDNGSTLENSRGVGSEEAWRDSEGHDRCPAGRLPRSSHENQ
ncbi:hypothetical protein OsJ_05981 [Oryza sativa Japonica Group]|uniref:Uncharacterized protein n=1 Tax=Oryza sativa subsp. japonica TaxID=39947 RepID=A3A4T8_ORYSJ|nr:hypothetical protein OsJ_05981 [Oryza sativa Japonica Group]